MTDHNQILYSSPLLNIGIFDCPADAPDFGNTGPIQEYLLAFPLTAVKIRHIGMRDPIIANPNVVTIYNRGQEYERYPLSSYGDRCYWLAVSPEFAREAIATTGNSPAGDPERLFKAACGASASRTYALLHRLIGYLQRSPGAEDICVQEMALTVFHKVINQAHSEKRPRSTMGRRATLYQRHRLIQRALEVLATRYREPLSLETLAREVNTSAYHLCRIFRDATGQTIHQYLTQLRLRGALPPLEDSRADLATIGVEAGFSDHSHFSRRFRLSFGVTPSSYRRAARDGALLGPVSTP